MYDKERKDKQTEIMNQEIWKNFTVVDFRTLKTLISLLDENEGSLDQEDTPETYEMRGKRVQLSIYKQDLEILEKAVKKK